MSSLLLAPSTFTSTNLPAINSAAFERPELPSSLSILLPHRGFHGFPSLSSKRRLRSKYRVVNSSSGSQPDVPPNSSPAGPGFGRRKGWIAGIVVTILLPFLKSKWGPLLLYKKEVDTVMQRVEYTAEVLEKAAEVVEKVAEDLTEDLPPGQLKRTADLVEHVAEEVAKTAHVIDAAIDKVEELEEKAESYMNSGSRSRQDGKTNEEAKINNEQA